MIVDKDIIFYLLGVRVLNGYIILVSCVYETGNWKFHFSSSDFIGNGREIGPDKTQKEDQTHKPISNSFWSSKYWTVASCKIALVVLYVFRL
jgi:hypothetical protein